MAGITPEGITIKRFSELLGDLRERAKPIFQDLVPPGEIVDVSSNSTLGRLTALYAIPLSDLWELGQQIYSAFDPNTATGVSLDNLVALMGVVRRDSINSSVTLDVWGTEGTYIPASTSEVRSQDSNMYTINDGVIFDRSNSTGAYLTISGNVSSGTTYGFEISRGSTQIIIDRVAQPTDSLIVVLMDLLTQMEGHDVVFDSSIEGEGIRIRSKDSRGTFSITPINMSITELRSITEATNQEVGAITQDVNTVTIIATPILGWVSVNNPAPAIPGRGVETDEELRLRFLEIKGRNSQNISDALYSTLKDIPSVRYVRIFENETSIHNPTYDLPPHSFKAVVLGGASEEIARAIWLNKPLGIGAAGNTTVTIRDSQGFQKDIKFDRPISKNTYIDITIRVNNDFPPNGDDMIKSALINYFDQQFGIGQDVIYSRLYTPINSVPGHQVDSLTVDFTPNPTGETNLTVGYNEIASLSTSNINIIHA